jgi:hypothetical protein
MTAHGHDDMTSKSTPASLGAGRRKLLKLGTGAAVPVLMALASRSAFACHSTTPSAFGSVCTSRPEVLQSSNGCDPRYWKNNPKHWPSPYRCRDEGDDDHDDDDRDDDDDDRRKKGSQGAKATTFNAVFCAGGAPSPFNDSVTLLQVLGTSNGGSVGVARNCVAALLNARSGRTPASILTADDVINRIWYEYMTRGFFEPVAGVRWYSDSPQLPYVAGSNSGGKGGIIGYLNTTWT